MPLFPISLKLRGRLCVVVGGGVIAESKIQSLLAAEAHVVVVAPEVTETVAAWARAGQIEWQARTFAAEDLCGAFLVVAGTSSAQVNHEVFQQCETEGILCNVVDDPEYCTFIIRRWCGAARCRSRFRRKGRVRRWRSGCGGNLKRNLGRNTNRGWNGWARRANSCGVKGKIPKRLRGYCISSRARKCSRNTYAKARRASGN